jgi:hypothetical protein
MLCQDSAYLGNAKRRTKTLIVMTVACIKPAMGESTLQQSRTDVQSSSNEIRSLLGYSKLLRM